MSSKVETVDIVRKLVDELDFTFCIDTCIDNLDGTFTLETCNTYHIQPLPNCKIEINGVKYVVTNVVSNVSITIKGSVKPVVTTFQVAKPNYYYGSFIMVEGEIQKQDKLKNVTFPIVYLKQVFADDFNNNSENPIDRFSDVEIFFLAKSNFNNWQQEDHQLNTVNQMRSLAYNFIETLNKSRLIDENLLTDYTLIDRINFGVTVTNKGSSKILIHADLTGVEMRVRLPINHISNCAKFCTC